MMPSFFHLYGLIIGVALWVGIFLSEHKAKQHHFPLPLFWQLCTWGGAGGVVGARLYHVATDFSVYQYHLWQILAFWQGGLSVIGAIFGVIFGVAIFVQLHRGLNIPWKTFADLCACGAPFAQAIGRLGNYVNQELYGLPTNLPWGIFIDPAHRVAGYQNQSFFHPLFLYEAVFMFGFGVWVWWCDRHKTLVGNGHLFLTYVLYYSVVRFVLDFLRLDKALFLNGPLSLNQVVVIIITTLIGAIWLQNKQLRQR